jgi:hypothetical protein
MNRSLSKTGVSLRLVLYTNEVARLPHTCHGVTVREGLGWVTVEGQDRILRAGDAATFEPGRFPAVVTALGGTPLILEVLGGERPRAASLIPARSSVSPACQEGVS